MNDSGHRNGQSRAVLPTSLFQSAYSGPTYAAAGSMSGTSHLVVPPSDRSQSTVTKSYPMPVFGSITPLLSSTSQVRRMGWSRISSSSPTVEPFAISTCCRGRFATNIPVIIPAIVAKKKAASTLFIVCVIGFSLFCTVVPSPFRLGFLPLIIHPITTLVNPSCRESSRAPLEMGAAGTRMPRPPLGTCPKNTLCKFPILRVHRLLGWV